MKPIQCIGRRRQIARLVHQEWMVWMAGIWEQLGPDCRSKWLHLTMGYSQLSEEDRARFEEVADRILAAVEGEGDGEAESGVRG